MIQTTVIVIADTFAELSSVVSSAPVAVCRETRRLHFRDNGNWVDADGATHSHGEGDVTGLTEDLAARCLADDARLSDPRTPTAHATVHQNGGSDEISVVGLSGLLADAQTPLAHTHALANITDAGSLAAKNTVATGDIDNDAVTYAKLQAVTDARLLGRSAGSAGDAQEIIVGSGLQLNAGALTATGGGGGVSQMIVPLISDGSGITWTNMPAAVTFFGGSHRFATKIDLSDYSQVRLIVNKQGTAGAASSVVRLRYRTAFDATVGNWLQIGTASVQVAVNTTNTVLDSGWVDLAAAAKADVFVVLDGSGGDGVLDPAFGAIAAQFR